MSTGPFTQSDATALLVRWLRQPDYGDYGSCGYGVYLPALVRVHLSKQGIYHGAAESKLHEMMPMLYAAAWDLCRRGILRPGVRAFNAQATADGASGNGYSITPFGEQWLAEADRDDFVPTEPERFAQILAPYGQLFGPSFRKGHRKRFVLRCTRVSGVLHDVWRGS